MKNHYEAKRARKVEALKERAERKSKVAEANSFDKVTGESNTGIPMGQPILIGHHSEKRHRKHLERIDNKLRKGFEAAEEAKSLAQRAEGLENRTAIDSGNPEAQELLAEKIERLESEHARNVLLNILVRQSKGDVRILAECIDVRIPEVRDALKLATSLLTPDFAGRTGIPRYVLANSNGNLARLRKRLAALAVVQSGFEPFTVGEIRVEYEEGQIKVFFPWKPNEETRSTLKRSPLALKWSSYSKAWVRKHTETTASQYFQQELKAALEKAAQ